MKRGGNGETERVVRSLIHFERGRERTVKCMGGGQTYWQRMRGEAGWGGLGCRSVRAKETDR